MLAINNCWRMLTVLLLLSLMPLQALKAQVTPDSLEPMMFPEHGPWGVVVHNPYHAKALKRLGVQWVRMDVRWNRIETDSRGNYDWSKIDRLINYYVDHDFKVLAILNVAHLSPLYKEERENREVVIEGIADWMGAAAERYAGTGVVWEIGNEPEVFPMGGYWSDPEIYTDMAKHAAARIKAADPEAKVAAISAAWMDRGFITQALEDGLLADGNVDVITFHGYHRENLMPESGLAEDVRWLRSMVERYSPQDQHVIVADSERGYAIMPFEEPKKWGNWRNKVYTEAAQAAYLARHYLAEIALGLEFSIWYKDMRGEQAYSLYYGDADDPRGLRPMGHVYRNLSALLPHNPKKMLNQEYPVSLTDVPDKQPDPNGQIEVRSYLVDDASGRRLVVAMWNPIEAFEGKILESRQRIDDHYHETWREVTEDDAVEVPVRVRIGGLTSDAVKATSRYDLLAHEHDETSTRVEFQSQQTSLVSQDLKVGPMPTVIVLNLEDDGSGD